MQNTIEDLFYGNIQPSEELRPKIGGYRDKSEEGYKWKNTLDIQLSDEQKKLFDAILTQSVNDMSCEVTQAFVEGFRLAARLMTEVYAAG